MSPLDNFLQVENATDLGHTVRSKLGLFLVRIDAFKMIFLVIILTFSNIFRSLVLTVSYDKFLCRDLPELCNYVHCNLNLGMM